MIKKMMFVAFATMVFMVVPALADQNCATGGFVGTYTRASPAQDTVGDGNLAAFLFQLTLHSDGTVTQNWTGLQHYFINTGSGSLNVGAWKCRDNGNLIVTIISATFEPVPADTNIGTVDDVRLAGHYRTTYVFNLNNNNTITRIKARTRTYQPADDPTDASGGTLGTLNTTPVEYKRLEASISDITAP